MTCNKAITQIWESTQVPLACEAAQQCKSTAVDKCLMLASYSWVYAQHEICTRIIIAAALEVTAKHQQVLGQSGHNTQQRHCSHQPQMQSHMHTPVHRKKRQEWISMTVSLSQALALPSLQCYQDSRARKKAQRDMRVVLML